MYRTIILPIDVNNADAAETMLDAAQRLSDTNTKVILLNVIENVPNYVSTYLPEGHEAKVQAHAMDVLARFAKSTPLQTEIELRNGHPSSEILAFSEEKNADAIIVASHRPGFEDYFLGSTAARIVQRANCSVLVVR